MQDPLIVTPYDSEWPARFRSIGTALRRELGESALRIDHIGSTAVPGLAAKPIVDIQISVAALEPMDDYRSALERIGYRWRADNDDRSKRYFRELPGTPRTHIHVRRHGSWSEQLALLFRDYLREHPADCREYVELKYSLATLLGTDRHRYVDEKGPLIWEMLRRADRWSQSIGRAPGPTDA